MTAPSTRELLARGVAAHRAGDLAAAEAAYRKLLEREPGNVDATHYLGMIAYQQGDLDAAAERVGGAATQRPWDPAILANLGLVLLAAGRTEAANRALGTAVEIAPRQPEAWHTLGLANERLGRAVRARECQRRALSVDPNHKAARLELARLLVGDDRPADAATVLQEGCRLSPADDDFGLALGETLGRAGLPDEASVVLRRLAERPGPARSRALTRLSLLERRRGRPAVSLLAARSAVFADPEDPDACRALGQALKELGRLDPAAEWFRRAHARLRAPGLAADADRPTFARTSRAKLRHDIAQLCYVIDQGIEVERLGRLLPEYEALLAALPADLPEAQTVPLPASHANRAAGFYNRCHYLADAPRSAEPIINPELDVAGLTAAYHAHAPGLTWIDGLLTPAALATLRRFCLESTIWYDFEHRNGYVGAYLQEGFNCPLLIQLAEALPRALPGIFRGHVPMQLWAYKYDSGLAGIDMHADFAAVNVNFWITPDEANLDPESGGLVLWDKEAPADWGPDEYNTYDAAQQRRIREFLEESGARTTVVPYRQNRCVVFNSDLFHRTDDIHFRDGYEDRRINITMLYGTRGADRTR
jgi:tetratricopeptide (TPR) repeat protein